MQHRLNAEFLGISEDDGKVAVVAEIGNAHNGDKAQAIELIRRAQAGGADFVKLQAYVPMELVALRGNGPAPEPWGSQGRTMLDLYEQAQTPLKWFPDLVSYCVECEMPWFASVFGSASLTAMEMLRCPAYKLAALDYRARSLREMVESTAKPIIRSCPLERVPRGPNPATMLYCPPGYPQTQLHLGKLDRRGFDGLSYHGTDILAPVMAVVHGARVVEVHVQLDDYPSVLEAGVSIGMDAFADMVLLIRKIGEWV